MEQIDLSGFFKTKSQARDFSLRLARVSELIFETDFQLEPTLTDEFGLQKKEALMALLRDNAINLEKPSAIKDFLTLLQKQVNAMPVLTLSLAFEAKDATLKVLSDWFLLNLKRQVLFDITVDPTLIAGLAIHFNGRYLDYSMRLTFATMLKEIFMPAAQIQPSHPVKPVLTDQSLEHITLGS